MTDAVQLLGVVIEFMKNVHGSFNLNPLNFVMFASFSWEYVLKITGIKHELLT